MSAYDEVRRARREVGHDSADVRYHLERAERDLRSNPTYDRDAARRDIKEALYELDDHHFDEVDYRLGRAERRLR